MRDRRGMHAMTWQVGPKAGYKEWLHTLRKTCTEAGVLLIFDEVMTCVACVMTWRIACDDMGTVMTWAP